MEKVKNEHAVAMGKIGGKNRWENIPDEKRSEMMREIANKRWAKKKEDLTEIKSTGSSDK